MPSCVSGIGSDSVSPLLGDTASEPLSPVRARPKSRSFAPERVSITLPGLRSRWTMLRPWAAPRASAICAPSETTCASGSGPRSRRLASVSPSTSSITRKSIGPPGQLGPPHVEERADVGMAERGDRLRLALEPLAALRVTRELAREHLDRDVAREPRVPGAVHLAHASGAEGCHDFVGSKTLARGEGHGC